MVALLSLSEGLAEQQTAATLTLTAANTNYTVQQLLAGVTTSAPTEFVEVDLVADQGNTTTVLLGDSSLSATNYGVMLSANDAIHFRSRGVDDPIRPANLYVRSGSASQVLHFIGRSK